MSSHRHFAPVDRGTTFAVMTRDNTYLCGFYHEELAKRVFGVAAGQQLADDYQLVRIVKLDTMLDTEGAKLERAYVQALALERAMLHRAVTEPDRFVEELRPLLNLPFAA